MVLSILDVWGLLKAFLGGPNRRTGRTVRGTVTLFLGMIGDIVLIFFGHYRIGGEKPVLFPN